MGTGELSSGGVRKGVGILEDYRCSGHNKLFGGEQKAIQTQHTSGRFNSV